MDESEQNAYWYKEIYRPVRNSPEVLQSHRSFLLFRDAASGLFILLARLVVVASLSRVDILSIFGSVVVSHSSRSDSGTMSGS